MDEYRKVRNERESPFLGGWKLFAVSLFFDTPWMVDTKTGSGIVQLPEHMTMNILADESPVGALVKAVAIHKDKGKHQWHSVAEIEEILNTKELPTLWFLNPDKDGVR